MMAQWIYDDFSLGRGVAALAFCLGLGTACGPPAVIGPEANEPKTDPEAQGAKDHRKDAKLEVARLRAHNEQYDPKAREIQRRCDPERATRELGEPICWYEVVNPTAVHLEEVEAHRLHAAYHRKAARNLSASEQRACKGVAKSDRNNSPFAHQTDILGVSALELSTGPRVRDTRLAGATVIFRPIVGLTQDDLQRLLDCHIAQNAVIGFDKAEEEMSMCLLTQRGVSASVRKVPEGLAVDVAVEDPGAAQKIWYRAQALAKVKKK